MNMFSSCITLMKREACRPLRTAPSYNRLKELGAQFGQVGGWERPNYFATNNFDDKQSRSFRRGGMVGACKMKRKQFDQV